MAEPEWKARVDRLDEVTIVQARLTERLEQKYDEAIQRHDEEMRDLRTALEKFTLGVEKLRSVVEAHEDGIAELRTAQVALIATAERHEDGFARLRAAQEALFERMGGLFERFDRFLRGQEGNGRKQ
jgi:hypothetical protein